MNPEAIAAKAPVRAQARFETVCVVGLGYIGLPTATAFALSRRQVIGVDINRNAVDTINRGGVHIVEPSLDVAVRTAVGGGYLRATTVPEPADAFLIAVPTPFGEGHKPDLRHVEAAARAIAPVLKRGDLVVLESTSPVGSTERLSRWLAEERGDLRFPHQAGEAPDVNIAYCPERVLPGHVMRELFENDRIIGGLTPACSERACELYGIFVKGDCIVSNARVAEMCKLTENAFRDVNIAFANELSMICETLQIDVWELIALANRHPRVNILQPGPGVGGHCIAVDPWFIVDGAPEQARLIRTAREVNDSKPGWVLERIEEAVQQAERDGRRREQLTIAVFGLSFKPDIDDLRESPALHIACELAARHPGPMLAVEPHISNLPGQLDRAEVSLVDPATALDRADIAVLLVDHRAFAEQAPPARLKIVDTRGLWT
ncbi:UDP-N-acetyl-D-mannosamine dehydrogenase [Luteimonas sp. SJ-92]|uniref:UDP-N-acetyl-D-mannosamine dehydrogenase n=1 Tax=Luteimonas salinisoli TaxID=2752307 RepID=A0A853JB24_9GAMM|nr:UDP-N-acetyl-D-mannosamine dehydrogenase [Luteimonas salinisoli]NZA25838.1 UDP-N-acetyl-D-mannosamine dehydrogenase [Luteimonas salinisoli]